MDFLLLLLLSLWPGRELHLGGSVVFFFVYYNIWDLANRTDKQRATSLAFLWPVLEPSGSGGLRIAAIALHRVCFLTFIALARSPVVTLARMVNEQHSAELSRADVSKYRQSLCGQLLPPSLMAMPVWLPSRAHTCTYLIPRAVQSRMQVNCFALMGGVEVDVLFFMGGVPL